jgi:Aldo/keto reductase family
MKKNLSSSEMNTTLDLNAQREFSRRRFLQVAAATGVSSVVPTAAVALETPAANSEKLHQEADVPVRALPNPIVPNFHGEYGSSSTPSFQIPKRLMGSTGLQVSILGVGGYHLGAALSQEVVNDIVGKALDHGINFFDNAWEYQGGAGEERLGIALKGKREQTILVSGVCTYGRKRDVAMRMLEDSLRRRRSCSIPPIRDQLHRCKCVAVYPADPGCA